MVKKTPAAQADPLQKAAAIALENLRACYKTDGIVAGNHHFTDYWARDGFFAGFGALAVGDDATVEKMVRLFFSHQRSDGLIPYRVMCGPISIGKYFGKPRFYTTPRPTYRLRGFGPEVLDGTTLTLLTCALLGLKNWRPAADFLPQIKKALRYLESREKYALLWDGVMSEWNDVTYKMGTLLYSNILYWRMLDRLTAYYKTLGHSDWKSLRKKAEAVAAALRERLWNGRFFADWADWKRQDHLYPFGNCLAVSWGFTSQEETESILASCKTVMTKFTLETNSPRYPWWRVDLLNYLTGMADYQNAGLLWWQPAAAYITALIAAGRKTEAKEQLLKAAEKIIADGAVYECYERSGKPVKRLLYASEHPFAWASGMIIEAVKKYQE